MGRRAVLLSLVIAGAGATIIAGSALADRTVITDPAGDGAEPGHARLDIRAAKATHHAPRGTRLSHFIRVEAGNIFNDGFLVIRARGRRYLVREQGVFQGSDRVGRVTVNRSDNGVIYGIWPRLIGQPSQYRWQAFTRLPDGTRFDAAPDADRVLHVLD